MRINNSLVTKVPVWQGFSGRNRLNSHSSHRMSIPSFLLRGSPDRDPSFLRTNALQRGFCRNTLVSTQLKRQWPDRCARPYPSLGTCGIYRHAAERIGQTRRTLSPATSPFCEEHQRFHSELLSRPQFCRFSAPQLRLSLIRLGY